METFLAISAITCYFLAGWRLLASLDTNSTSSAHVVTASVGLGALLHLGYLHQVMLLSPGQDMSITNVLSLVAWLISVSVIASARLLPHTIISPVVYLFTGLTVLAAWGAPSSHIMQIGLQPGLLVHICLSLFSYCILVIAFLYAVQMSFITHRLKQKGASLLNSPLPPLTLVEQVLFKLLTVGTILLAVALMSGFVFLDDMFSKAYAHKTVLSLLALAVLVLLLIGQKLWGWRGKQVITLTITGVFLLSLAYFGSKLVREVLL